MLQPLCQEYEDYSPRIDEVNDLGNAYDALQKGEPIGSPVRRSKYIQLLIKTDFLKTKRKETSVIIVSLAVCRVERYCFGSLLLFTAKKKKKENALCAQELDSSSVWSVVSLAVLKRTPEQICTATRQANFVASLLVRIHSETILCLFEALHSFSAVCSSGVALFRQRDGRCCGARPQPSRRLRTAAAQPPPPARQAACCPHPASPPACPAASPPPTTSSRSTVSSCSSLFLEVKR